MPSIKGTSSLEDARAHGKLLRSTKFPSIFHNTTIDPSKVNKAIVNVWIDREITSLLGFDDEIVSNTATNLFGLTDEPSSIAEGGVSTNESFDPRNAHIVLSGFLGEEASLKFCTKLLELLLDASQQPMGIPRQLIEEKKRQLMMAAAAVPAPVVPSATSVPAPAPPMEQNGRKRPNRWDSNDAESGGRNDDNVRMIDRRSNDDFDEYGRRHREIDRKSYAVVEEEPPSRRLNHDEEPHHRSLRGSRDREEYPDSSSRRRYREDREERYRRHDDGDTRHRRHGDPYPEERHRRHDDDDHSYERHWRRSDREDRDYIRSRHERRRSRDDHYKSRRGSSPDRDHSDREYSRKRRHRHDRDRSP